MLQVLEFISEVRIDESNVAFWNSRRSLSNSRNKKTDAGIVPEGLKLLAYAQAAGIKCEDNKGTKYPEW